LVKLLATHCVASSINLAGAVNFKHGKGYKHSESDLDSLQNSGKTLLPVMFTGCLKLDFHASCFSEHHLASHQANKG
jgi:hypothetical protein